MANMIDKLVTDLLFDYSFAMAIISSETGLSQRIFFDNLGIRIDVAEKIPAFAELREMRRKTYGSGFLSRLWMHYVFPFLSPKRYKFFVTQCNNLAIEAKQQMLDAILEQCQPDS